MCTLQYDFLLVPFRKASEAACDHITEAGDALNSFQHITRQTLPTYDEMYGLQRAWLFLYNFTFVYGRAVVFVVYCSYACSVHICARAHDKKR